MKRLRSIKLKFKRNIPGSNSLKLETQSISSLLEITIDPKRQRSISLEMDAISKYTFRGKIECLKLKKLVLEHLNSCIISNNYAGVLKLINLLIFVCITGSTQFYYLFVNADNADNGSGIWRLKALHETIIGDDTIVEQIRRKVSDLVRICQDYDCWMERRDDYEAIRNEIYNPSSRHSFESQSRGEVVEYIDGKHTFKPGNPYKKKNKSLDRIDEER